jgi:hypothetical protein
VEFLPRIPLCCATPTVSCGHISRSLVGEEFSSVLSTNPRWEHVYATHGHRRDPQQPSRSTPLPSRSTVAAALLPLRLRVENQRRLGGERLSDWLGWKQREVPWWPDLYGCEVVRYAEQRSSWSSGRTRHSQQGGCAATGSSGPLHSEASTQGKHTEPSNYLEGGVGEQRARDSG